MLAYLDAASGSLIVQAIVAGAAGAAVFFKLGWRRITSPFRRRTAPAERRTAPAERRTAPAEVGERRDER
jgi:hypothetical protein